MSKRSTIKAACFGAAVLALSGCSHPYTSDKSFSAAPPNGPSNSDPMNGQPVNPQNGTTAPAKSPAGTGGGS
jgi:hypothetical protein